MLRGFVSLAAAQPEEMAAWLERYGVLALCQHGHPVEGACVFKTCPGMLDGGRAVDVRAVRDVARTFGAALRLASQLARRKPGDRADWVELQNLLGSGSLPAVQVPGDRADYRLQQERYAQWLERCFEQCRIGHEIRWRARGGLQVTPMPTSLVGVLVFLLYRENVGREPLRCDNCGATARRGPGGPATARASTAS